MSRIITALALTIAFPALALAHGPSRKKEVTSIEINAPIEKVWAVVGNYADMSWVPAIEKTEATGGTEINIAKRKLTFKSGAIFTDTLSKYEPAAYTIGFMTNDEDLKTLPVEGYSSTFTLTPAGTKTNVEWKGAFYRGYMNNDAPPELSDAAAIKAVTAYQKAGLDALKAKLESGN